MPQKFFKHTIGHYLPSQKELHDRGVLGYFSYLSHQPQLWHFNRHSIAAAFFIGLFIAMIPLPLQMLMAAFCAMIFQANLPLSVSLVWISNPLTIAPIFYFSYRLGAWLLQIDVIEPNGPLTWDWLSSELLSTAVIAPLITGSLLIGTVFGLTGYHTVNWLWRRRVIKRWRQRKLRIKKITSS